MASQQRSQSNINLDVEQTLQSPVAKRYWEGVYASPNGTHAKQFYGPSSLCYFIKRMEQFLTASLKQPPRDQTIWFNSASKTFASPTPERTRDFAEGSLSGSTHESHHGSHSSKQEQYLTKTQEEYFLNLFWQSYHCSMQIIDESAFRDHYRSLCNSPGRSRKPSALVDIIVAICMQYGIAFLDRRESATQQAPANEHNPNAVNASDAVDIDDATIAGRWHYYRCQSLLAAELESPTITTLQCHIFTAIYLCNASFQNMAHSTLAQAVRTAHMLGLHLDPPEHVSETARELRKRLWWTLQTIEIKTCMKLGRPFATSFPPETCSLPSDDYQLALLSSSTTSVEGGVTWLSYTVQNTKLVLAARATHVAFFEKCNEVLTKWDKATIYEDSQALEECAEFLQASIQGPEGLETWLRGLPDVLKPKRRNGGKSFSTDCSALDMERFAPTWLQRHRLLLELLYHNLLMNLYRPFITFPSAFPSPAACVPISGLFTSSSFFTLRSHSPTTRTPLAEQNAISCIRHAIALTNMMHETLKNTEFLTGWHEAFQWQWNAASTLIGFILANPGSAPTQDARKAIDRAIEVFDIFGRHFAVGASAASVTRQLTAKADILPGMMGQRGGLDTGLRGDDAVAGLASAAAETRLDADGAQCISGFVGLGLGPGNAEAASTLSEMVMIDDETVRTLLDDTMNMAYGVDCFGGVDISLPENFHMPNEGNI